jgi:hypothetical protein
MSDGCTDACTLLGTELKIDLRLSQSRLDYSRVQGRVYLPAAAASILSCCAVLAVPPGTSLAPESLAGRVLSFAKAQHVH